MEVPAGWTDTNTPGSEESLSWTVVTRAPKSYLRVRLYARQASGTEGAFEITIHTTKRTESITNSDAWSWSRGQTFYLRDAGEHTLKVHMKTDGSRLAKVRVGPYYSSTVPNSIWFQALDADSFTSGALVHEETKKCIVRAQHGCACQYMCMCLFRMLNR